MNTKAVAAKGKLAKSFNRTNDVLPNTPLRSSDWLKEFVDVSDPDKKVLAETWLSRYFQHTRGMKQDDYDGFIQKLWVRQIDWLAAMVPFVGPAYFATQDIGQQQRGIYDVLWNPEPADPEYLWMRSMWLGNTEDRLAALPLWWKVVDPIICGNFGNLIPVLAVRTAELPEATYEHKKSAVYLSLWTGEQGPRREPGLPQSYAMWQDLGYFGNRATYNSTIPKPTKEEALAIIRVVSNEFPEVFLENFVNYLEMASTPGADGLDYADENTVFTIPCALDGKKLHYHVLATWMPQHQGYWQACIATDTRPSEACKALRERLELAKKDINVDLPNDLTEHSDQP